MPNCFINHPGSDQPSHPGVGEETKIYPKPFQNMYPYLEDHPRTCKWLISMVCKSPKDRVLGPLANGLFMACRWG